MKTTKRFLSVAIFIALALTFSCSSDDDGGGGRNICTDEQLGCVPSSVIPESIRMQFENVMPIYSGTNPPDISGQYLSNGQILVGSSLSYDDVGSHYIDGIGWANKNIAFINEANGKLSYRSKQGTTGQGQSDDVTVVEIVGSGNNFTAYFVEDGVSYGISNKKSVLISGTLTSSGISNYHDSFILLEKGSDPQNKLVSVGTYRIFKDGDGLAERHDWYSGIEN